jgi:hypothetical protein
MIQAHISQSLEGLELGLIEKYGLMPYEDWQDEVIFFGMYREDDFTRFVWHPPTKCKIVWFGSDALDLPLEMVCYVNQTTNIAVSKQVQATLKAKGIDSIYRPINAVIPNNFPKIPNGDNLFWYYGNAPEFYGLDLIDEIEKRLSIPIVRVGYNELNKTEIINVYKQCFLNLRLTPHDGCPNTNIEMGLMGRKSIYNGDLPCSIEWDSIGSICNTIETEYQNRKNDNTIISQEFINFTQYERMPKMFI